MKKQPLSIYVHIPFCIKKCNYCDFLSFPAKDSIKKQYVLALIKEIEGAAIRLKTAGVSAYYNGNRILSDGGSEIRAKDKRTSARAEKDYAKTPEIQSIYFGGGTPSCLPADFLCSILCKLKQLFTVSKTAEISIEVNPGTVAFSDLAAYREAGFNRLSIGCQSMRDASLKALGRIHRRADFFTAFNSAREAGFRNINVDLMSGLPNEEPKAFLSSLTEITDLKPEHISVYSLIIEPGTLFYEDYQSGRLSLPDEDTVSEIDSLTRDTLAGNGYERYEISNFSLPGYQCRHNTVYWKRGDYLGFGLGAASLLSIESIPGQNNNASATYSEKEKRKDDSPYPWIPAEKEACSKRFGRRSSNTRDLFNYLKAPGVEKSEDYSLSERDAMEEFLFLGLRLTEGVSEADFRLSFNKELTEVFGETLKTQEKEGFLIHEKGRYHYTEQGLDLSTRLLSEFLV